MAPGPRPPRRRCPRSLYGFPRPRGDGPYTVYSMAEAYTVSPPTRGWPCFCDPRVYCVHGFPAHAGMALYPGPQRIYTRGFPRPRGDGPSTACPARLKTPVSPPTRGWPSVSVLSYTHGIGFPAHAGMAPYGPALVGPAFRFPRPRGDGPSPGCAATHPRQVSPPTRGWPCPLPALRRLKSGFPAHAGMALCKLRQKRSLPRFPRPRGDGPPSVTVSATAFAVSPPTRGWPGPKLHTPCCCGGFPAHAGMAPRHDGLPLCAQRFPRPRGDGPLD